MIVVVLAAPILIIAAWIVLFWLRGDEPRKDQELVVDWDDDPGVDVDEVAS